MFSIPAVADNNDDPFESEGLNLVAIRNDTLDSNQDGIVDAVRVVIVINSTQGDANLLLTLIGDHQGISVKEDAFIQVINQENASLTYDSWTTGEHYLSLEISDSEGRLLKIINIGSFDLSPALKVPEVSLELNGNQVMETGDHCEIHRTFYDETGPRWGFSGTRSITGTPFKVLDSETLLDCSNWPAGSYEISETYQNGLGQTASDVLELRIENKPPPEFSIQLSGDGDNTGTPCTISHIPANGEDHSMFEKEWSISPSQGMASNVSNIDCSQWEAGVYKILLKVTNNEQISTTEGQMLIRYTNQELSSESEEAPVISKGQNTETTKVGFYGVIGISVILGIIVFIFMSRGTVDDLISGIIGDEIQPDPEGLPTHTDENGMLWRKHTDGELDWWDRLSDSWKRW
ncbi:MAG: hypothetical protein ACPHDO_03950 [Candidatus Poseidoniaceae archaeon]